MPLAARRAARRGVVGPAPVARTAAVVGTAAVVTHGVARRSDRRQDRRGRPTGPTRPLSAADRVVRAVHARVRATHSAETRHRCVTTRRLTAVVAVFAVFVPASTPATASIPAPAAAAAAWTGVSEVVLVEVDADGVVSDPPIPDDGGDRPWAHRPFRSECRCRRPDSAASDRDRHRPSSTTSRSSRSMGLARRPRPSPSDFVQPLPVTITPSYELDGQSTTPEELSRSLTDRERRSGVLTVTYEIANVTSETTTVSFVDAAGTRRSEVVTQAVPIAGALTLTFPRSASGIDAPGATLTPGASGVGAQWTVMLAPPLSPTQQSISYSMNVINAADPARQAVARRGRALQPTGRRRPRGGWCGSCDGPGHGAGAARGGPGPGAGVARAGAGGPRGARGGAGERADTGARRVRRALGRPRATLRRRALRPVADDLDDR